MIFTALAAARAFLSRLPWQLWLALAVLVSCWLWGNHRYAQGEAHVEAKYAAARAQAFAQARKADAAALDTAQTEKAASGAEIERGREAAKGSADPWDAAVKAMRHE